MVPVEVVMKTLKLMTQLVVLFAIAVTLGACGGKNTVKSNLHIKGAPNWVNKGTSVLKDKDGRLFHGVGMAEDLGNMSLQKSTADNRARAEIARILSSYMDIVENDYITANRADGQNVSQEDISRQIKNVSQTNLAGAKIIGRWRDKKTSTIFSLAELDMRYVKQTINSYREMNAGLRKFMEQNADTAFDKLEQSK
jgi:hypothetical protein